MSVAPDSFVRLPATVSVGDVHAADISDFAVYDHDLTVIAPVNAIGEVSEGDAEEGMDEHSVVAHPSEETVVGMEAAHLVVDHHHFHALFGLFDKNVGDFIACAVVGENVILQINRFAGIAQVGFQRFEFVGAVGEDLDCIVDGVERGAESSGEFYEISFRRGERKGFEVYIAGGHFIDDPAFVMARNHVLPLEAPAEDEIEDEADYGEENEGYHPCERPDGIAVLLEHHHDTAHNSDGIGRKDEICKPIIETCHGIPCKQQC